VSPRLQKTWVLIAAVLAVWTTASLGFWQLRRADDKLARQAAMAERAALPPLNNATLPCDEAAWSAQSHRRVTLSGHWQPQYTWLLDNRAMDGRAGFFVVTALLLDGAGTCPIHVVLVQRGWLPRHAQDRTRVPPFETPSGLVTLTGALMPELSRAFSLGAELSPVAAAGLRIVQNVDFAALPAQLGQAVRPGAVLQWQPEILPPGQATPDPSTLPLLRDWPAPASDVGKHHAYAAQWFAMAALITGLYVWFQLVSPLRQRSR
jgi:surfeit locus 1 family protein